MPMDPANPRHTLELLELIYDAIPTGVVVYDKDGRMAYANAAAARLAGFSAPEGLVALPNEQLQERTIILDEEGEIILPNDYSARLAREGVRTRNRRVLMKTRAGAYHWLNVSSAPLYDAQGEVAYTVTFATDITEQKSREERLRFLVESMKILSITMDFHERLREKAKLTVPSLADWCAIDLVTESGFFRAAHVHRKEADRTAFEHAYERFPESLIGPGNLRSIVAHSTPLFYHTITDDLLKKSASTQEEARAMRALSLSSMMILPIASSGRVLGTMSLAYTTSGRIYTESDLYFMQEFCSHLGVLLDNARLYEEVRKHNQAKDAFIATLSHELRNPLAPIKSSLEILRTFHQLGASEEEQVGIIEHQFDHMTRLLNDLLTVTRFTQNQIRLEKERLDLRALIESTARANQYFVASKNISLTFDVLPEAVEVLGDRTRLQQAITNLLNNAVKFTPSGGVIVLELAREGSEAKIRVRDSGAGIEPDDLKHLFELHFSSQRRSRPNAGLGIGLVLVREIVKLHEGTVSAYSEGPGKGSVFTIVLPVAVPASPKPPEPPAAPRVSTTCKVLVVDDNDAAAKGIGMLLEHSGHVTKLAHDGRSALELAREFEPSMVLLDIGLPDVDGYEVARRMREIFGTMRPTIVALTGYGQDEDKRKAKKAGFDHHLTKPVSFSQIQAILDTNM